MRLIRVFVIRMTKIPRTKITRMMRLTRSVRIKGRVKMTGR